MDGWMDGWMGLGFGMGFGFGFGVSFRYGGKAWEDWAVKLNELAQLCCLLSIAESKSVKKLLT